MESLSLLIRMKASENFCSRAMSRNSTAGIAIRAIMQAWTSR
jgi:hypothetical protein